MRLGWVVVVEDQFIVNIQLSSTSQWLLLLVVVVVVVEVVRSQCWELSVASWLVLSSAGYHSTNTNIHTGGSDL